MATRRRIMVYAIGIPVLVALAAAVILATSVEDWSRDLTTNRAATTPDARDRRLRPLDLAVEPNVVLSRLDALVAGSNNWQDVSPPKPLPVDSPLPSLWRSDVVETRHFVHLTGLMRFRDDVWVAVEPSGEHGSRVWGESRSRIGKGDLGQNPRNLRELLEALHTGDRGE